MKEGAGIMKLMKKIAVTATAAMVAAAMSLGAFAAYSPEREHGSGSGGGGGRYSWNSTKADYTKGATGPAAQGSGSEGGRWIETNGTWAWQYNNGGYAVGWQRLPWQGGVYWYFFGQDGLMKEGWQDINGKSYYLEPTVGANRGHMYENTVTPDGAYVDASGARN